MHDRPVSARLMRAYRQTRYEVAGIAVHAGQRSPGLDALLRRHRVKAGVFVTAWNPYSRLMPAGWNQRQQRALLARLRRGTALPASGSWRRWHEDHIFAMGPTATIIRWARLFRQNMVLTARVGQKTVLRRVGLPASPRDAEFCRSSGSAIRSVSAQTSVRIHWPSERNAVRFQSESGILPPTRTGA